MVTRILFDPRRDLATGTTDSSPVTVEATPTGIREDGSVVILPSTLTFTVNTGADQVLLVPPAASWAWRLVVRQNGQVKQQRTVRFADTASAAWADLVDVDPATLGDSPGHSRQWDATFWQLMQLLGGFGDQLAAITSGSSAALDSFFEVAQRFGLDEATVAALQALVAGKPDRTELVATYSPLAQLAASPDLLAVGTITRSATGAATSFSVGWPDGSTGTFTGTESTTAPGAIDSYTVTKTKGGITVTFTQPLLTRNATGAVTNRPAITVA
jgi:hypothetical protein